MLSGSLLVAATTALALARTAHATISVTFPIGASTCVGGQGELGSLADLSSMLRCVCVALHCTLTVPVHDDGRWKQWRNRPSLPVI